MVTRVKTSVDLTAINSLFGPESGVFGVHDNGVRMSRAIRRLAETIAPVRSGELKSKHNNTTSRAFLHTYASVWNTADHAIWVHEGVPGYIVPKGGTFLKLAPYGPYPTLYRQYVRGQDANPWLTKAMGVVVRSYVWA